MNKNTRGHKLLPLDHHSQRLRGPDRKAKHRRECEEIREYLEDLAETNLSHLQEKT